jgi:hypothetical protein
MAVRVRDLDETELPQAEALYGAWFRHAYGEMAGRARAPGAIVRGFGLDRSGWLAAELDGDLVGLCPVWPLGSVRVMGLVALRTAGPGGTAFPALVEAPGADAGGPTAPLRVAHALPNSPTQLDLYIKQGFWPWHLTAVMTGAAARAAELPAGWCRVSALEPEAQRALVTGCDRLLNTIHPGLSIERTAWRTLERGAGDLLVLPDGAGEALAAALCHYAPAEEAFWSLCQVKVGAVRAGPGAPARFDELVQAVKALASAQQLGRVMITVNTLQHAPYRRLHDLGLSLAMTCAQLRSPDVEGLGTPDDWFLLDGV